MDSALLSFFQLDKDLVTDTRPLRLRLAHPTQMLEDVLLPQQVHGSESICGSLEYRILCVSLDAFIPLKELIALPIAVDIVTDRGDLRSICGIVTEASAGDSDGGLASYQLVMRDALSIMEKRTNTRVFRNKNEMEIVEVILDEWRTTNPIVGTCFRYETDELFRSEKYPQREFTMQYNESDAAFIRRMLKRRGIAWYFRAEQSKSPTHTMVLFNHPHSLQPNAAGVVRYHRDASTEERDTITSWCAVRTLQPASVTRFSWDYKRPGTPGLMFTTAEGRSDQGENGNYMAASLDDYQVLAPHAGDDYEDLCQLGELAMKRHDFDSKCFHGEGSVRDMCVGEYFTLEGHPEIDSHHGKECDFVVTSMQVTLTNNLSQAMAERVQRLFSRNRWMGGAEHAPPGQSRYHTRIQVSFTAVRHGIAIVPAYDPRTEVPNVPMQSAMVVGPSGEEVYCDELGRVKVRFRTTRTGDHDHAQGAGALDSEADSAWIRVSNSWTGSGPGSRNQCGSIFLPRVGAEVVITFLEGDPDRPLVMGQLYNGSGLPPSLNGEGRLPGNRYVSGIRSKEIQGSRASGILFDDSSGEIGVQVACEHAQTQLNLGNITDVRGAEDAVLRGEGAELTTEESVAIRGSKGLLLTAEPSDAGSILMRDGLIGVLEAMSAIATGLCELNGIHCKDQSVAQNLNELLGRLNEWSSREKVESSKSLLAGSSQDGIAFATASTAAIGAQEQVDVISAKDVHLQAGRALRAMAMQGLTLFSHDKGVKVISAKGPTRMESQDGDLEIVASGQIRICAGQSIELLAPEIKLASKGAQADYGLEKVVHQSKAEFIVKSSKFEHTAGGSGRENEIDFPASKVETDERVYLVSSQSGKPVAGRRYRIDLPDGRTVEGESDADGRTELVAADEIGEIEITIFPANDSHRDGGL